MDDPVPDFFIRPEGEEFDFAIYDVYEQLFSIKCHYYGRFSDGPNMEYIEGEICFVDLVNKHDFSDAIMNTVMNSLGYEMDQQLLFYYKIPLKTLEVGVKPLVSDADYQNFLSYVHLHKVMYVYVELVEKEDESESWSETENEPDNDLVDDEHVVEDVEVNMNEFHFEVADNDPMVPKVTLNEDTLEVLDFDSMESDIEDVPENARRLGLRKLKKLHSSAKFYVGREFANRDVAKQLIRSYAVESRRNLHFKRNDPVRIRVVCNGVVPSNNHKNEKVQGPNEVSGKISEKDKICCPWVLYLSKGEKGKWVIKTYKDDHHCLQSRKIKYCTSTFLSKHITDLLIMNPNIPVKAVQEQMQKRFHVAISRDKTFRAKEKAEVYLRGDVKVQYSFLRDYVMELKRCNPDTTCKIDVYGEENHESPTRMFRRIYVCLGALKRGFKESGRELLGLDGAFMRGHYPGQMLTAVGVDANNGIYPVAYGIVESENQHSWTWFLKCLADDLDLYTNSNFTFITDRQKGLLPALEKLFPSAEHRYCVRHIYENMNQTWKGIEYKEMLWKCASSTTTVLFEQNMKELKDFNLKAYQWLKKIPAEHWSRAYFSGRAHCDLLIKNVCEVFNRQLLDARDSPIITALEHVREYLMKRIVIVQKVIEKSDGPLTPAVAKVFEKIKTAASECIVDWNGSDLYQVKGHLQEQYVVNLPQKTCSCRKWEISGIPCKHAVAAIHDMLDNGYDVGIPEDWVHESYKLATWKAVYSHKVNPVNGRDLWAKFDCPTTLLPPKIHPQIGRPSKKRKKSKGEIVMVKGNKLSRAGKGITCGLCKSAGHNKRSCDMKNVAVGASNARKRKNAAVGTSNSWKRKNVDVGTSSGAGTNNTQPTQPSQSAAVGTSSGAGTNNTQPTQPSQSEHANNQGSQAHTQPSQTDMIRSPSGRTKRSACRLNL